MKLLNYFSGRDEVAPVTLTTLAKSYSSAAAAATNKNNNNVEKIDWFE